MLDLRVDPTAFAACVRRAVEIWLRRRGSSDEAVVTTDGDGVRIELGSSGGGYEGIRVVGPSLTIATGGVESDASDGAFDEALFDLIREEMSVSDDLIVGRADDLS